MKKTLKNKNRKDNKSVFVTVEKSQKRINFFIFLTFLTFLKRKKEKIRCFFYTQNCGKIGEEKEIIFFVENFFSFFCRREIFVLFPFEKE